MQLSGKTVLLTGGAGFIGSHLADVLSDCKLRIVDDFSTGHEENISHHRGRPDVQIVRGDVRDPKLLADVVAGIDVIFHLACRGVRHSIGHPVENHEVNATGTLRLLEAARREGIQRFIHVSSSEIYGTATRVPMDEEHPTFPETVYGALKLAGECYARAFCRTYGLPTVVIRPFNNFGPRSHYEGDSGEVIPRFVVWALNGRPPLIFGDGYQTRDFIYVEETVAWLRRAAECEGLIGETINLGSGRETSVRELAELVYDVVGNGRVAPEFHPPRPGDVRRHFAGVEKARRILGFETQISLRAGIERLVAHLRAKPGGPAELVERADKINWTA